MDRKRKQEEKDTRSSKKRAQGKQTEDEQSFQTVLVQQNLDKVDSIVKSGVSQEVVPQEVVSQKVVSQEVVPQEIVSQQVVPQEIVSQQVVPQEIVSQEVVPQEIAPQEVVPQEECQTDQQSLMEDDNFSLATRKFYRDIHDIFKKLMWTLEKNLQPVIQTYIKQCCLSLTQIITQQSDELICANRDLQKKDAHIKHLQQQLRHYKDVADELDKNM